MKIFKPMLAGVAKDLNKIKFPVLVSPKLDGIRCLVRDGKAQSRSLKPIPNDHIRTTLEKLPINGLDGEIMITNTDNFNKAQGDIMRKAGTPNFVYCVFDYITESGFSRRQKQLHVIIKMAVGTTPSFLKIVPQTLIHSVKELVAIEAKLVGEGYEGVMIRSLEGPYKCGRSTENEGFLLKLKRFHDSEAVIVDKVELMRNTNEAKKDALGHTERSTKKEGMVGANMLGCLVVKDVKTGNQFEIGTGFTRDQRIEIWNNFNKFKTQMVKYKYQELSVDGIPRFPVFLGFRDKKDMS